MEVSRKVLRIANRAARVVLSARDLDRCTDIILAAIDAATNEIALNSTSEDKNMRALEALTKAGFEVTVESGEDYDADFIRFVKAAKRAVIHLPDGRKKRGVGANEFRGGGATIEEAVTNMIENAEQMAVEMNVFAFGTNAVEPNMDRRTAREFPIKDAA